MWTDGNGLFYAGDCRLGDRAATDGEVAAWQAAQAAVVPSQVTSSQLIRAVNANGMLATIQAAVTTMGGLQLALWNHAPFWHRNDPLFVALATALGKTSTDMDNIFISAATFPQ
jgi:hypothetical protein